jgi:hypothetical protein
VVVRDPGGDHDQLERARQSNRLRRECARVDEQRGSGLGQARRERIQDPDRRADQLVLAALREARERHVVELEREQRAQSAQHCHLERRARRESRADRYVGLDA